MPIAPTHWILAVTMFVGTAAPSIAFSQPAGDSTSFSLPGDRDQARLRKSFESGRPVRITASGTMWIMNSPKITAEGVASSESFAEGADTLPQPNLIHWTEIEGIEKRGNAAGVGALTGAIVFGCLAIAAGASVQNDPMLGGNQAGVMAGVAGGTLLGAGVGALIGLGVPRWVNAYEGRPAK